VVQLSTKNNCWEEMVDPNVALEGMRVGFAAMHDAALNDDSLAYEEAALGISEHAQALDDWLSRCGFLPEAWQR